MALACRHATSVKPSAAATSATAPTKTGPGNTVAHAEAPTTSSSAFAWERNWWPVMPLSYLDPSRPTPVELLGMPLVVWQDGSGAWRCFQDMCPHRLAPLSGAASAHSYLCCVHALRMWLALQAISRCVCQRCQLPCRLTLRHTQAKSRASKQSESRR